MVRHLQLRKGELDRQTPRQTLRQRSSYKLFNRGFQADVVVIDEASQAHVSF